MILPSRCPLRPRDRPAQNCRRPDERPGSYATPRDTTSAPRRSSRCAGAVKRFKSPRQVQRFLSIHDLIANLFHLRRDSRPVSNYRAARAQAFTAWVEVAGAPLAA